jgi:uncharacterized short protein YbdD (DUF466 family)
MMLDRGQSNVVGAILLLSLVTVTVGGTGMIALSQWEDDIGYEPMTNIESEMTSVNLTLEHRTGEALYPENTTIRVVGVNDSVEMEDVLSPGGRQTIGFNRSTGSVKLYIIDDSTGTVLHSDTHTIRNPFVGLFFSVDGFTQPVYLLEGHSANYSVEKAYEFGSPDIFTRDARINIGDGSISSVDEGDTTITGVQTGETSLTVEADGSTGETQVIVLESDPALDVDSDVTTTGVKSADLDMDLLDLAGLPQVSLTAEYWPSHVFNERPNNNSDFVLADGGYYTPYGDEPSGYTHKDGYVHDNVPLDEGETRTYRFFDPGSGADYAWYLREGQQEDTDGLDDYTDYVRDYNNNVPDGAYRVEVTLSEDGDSIDVVLYDEASGGNIVREDRDLDVSDYDELYFTSYAHIGNDYNRRSLRLTGIDTYTANKTVQVDSKADVERLYSESLSNLDMDRDYRLTAKADQEIGGQTVSSTESLTFGTRTSTVETVGVNVLGPKSIEATGELVDLGDLDQTDLLFEYWPSRFFNRDSTNNGDYVISNGGYYTPNDDDEPSGYTHKEGYVHDNVPLDEGETRTYTFYDRGSGADYAWSLRDSVSEDPDELSGYIGTSVRDYNNNVPDGAYRVEVTLSEDGDSIDVVLYDEASGGNIVREDRDLDVSDHDELYFTSYGYFGYDYNRRSLRLTGIDTYTAKERVTAENAVESEKMYSSEINGLEPDRHYRLSAYTEAENDGVTVTDTGDPVEFIPKGPTIETVAADSTGATSFEAKAELVDRGDVDWVDIFFEYRPSRHFNEDATNNSDYALADGGYYDPDDEPGGYMHKEGFVHDNVPLTPGVTRTYRFFDPGSGADYAWYLREGQQEDTDGLDDYTDYVRDYNNNVPDGAYRVEVTLSEDGDSIDVVLYDEASGGNIVREDRDLDVSDYDELYFSSYGYFGNDYNRHSLRLTGIDEYSNTETVQTASATSSEQVYTEEITEVEPNRDYVLTAYAESNVDSVGDSGDMVDFGLDGQTVETVSVTNLKNKKVQVTGELTDLGDLQQADLYIDYWQSHIFNANPTNNSDHVIADGKYYAPSDEPNGYIHNDQFVHDNAALEKGETRTYTYYNPGSGAKYSWYLRDGEQLEPDGGVDNSIDTSVRDYYTSVPNDKYRIEVTLSQNGKDLDVVLFDSATGGNIVREDRNIDVSGHKDLYFTTYGYFGDDYDRYSLRLIGIDTFSDQDRVRVEKDVTTEQTYTTDINVDVGRGYRYQAYSEELVGGYNVNSTGGVIAYRNGG